MRLRTPTAAALLFALVGTAAGQKPESKVHTSVEGKYKVRMLAGVKTEKKPLKVGGMDLTIHTASAVISAKSAVVVTHVEFTEPVTDARRKEMVEKTALGAAQKGKMVTNKEYEHGAEKYPGRDCLIENANHHVRYRGVLAGQRMYQIMVLGPKEFVTGKEADAIIDSFEVTK